MVVKAPSKAAVEAAVPEQEATQVPVLEEVEKSSAPERVVGFVVIATSRTCMSQVVADLRARL